MMTMVVCNMHLSFLVSSSSLTEIVSVSQRKNLKFGFFGGKDNFSVSFFGIGELEKEREAFNSCENTTHSNKRKGGIRYIKDAYKAEEWG